MKKSILTKNFEGLKFAFSLLILITVLYGVIGCSSDDEDDPQPPEQRFTASFDLSDDGYDETVTYNGTDNLIFCRLTGNDMWIRLARDKTSNGEDGPHIDIDICNYVGVGMYSPVDPENRPCPDGLLWNIFWHDENRVYSNKEDSSPCQLTLTLNEDILTGVFNCSQVARFQGSEIIGITNGTFNCKIE